MHASSPRRRAGGRFALLLAMAVLAVGVPAVAPELTWQEPGAPGLVGGHLHSRFLLASSPVTPARLAAWAQQDGLQAVAVGVPIGGPGGVAGALAGLGAWLEATPRLPMVPEFNTFTLPKDRQDAAGLGGLLGAAAQSLQGHAQVRVAVGGNEPLSRARGWQSFAQAAERVALEHRLWHEASDLPFCHKFTNPRLDPIGTRWGDLEALWADHQDAICYDWYVSNGDTLATLDHLRAVGQKLGKPVYVLEAAVPFHDPGLRDALAARADMLLLYPWLAPTGGEDARLAGFWVDGAGTRAPGPAAGLMPAAQPP